jgi:hypothetical protein
LLDDGIGVFTVSSGFTALLSDRGLDDLGDRGDCALRVKLTHQPISMRGSATVCRAPSAGPMDFQRRIAFVGTLNGGSVNAANLIGRRWKGTTERKGRRIQPSTWGR